MRFPLRGDWLVETTPAHRIPSHGTDLFGQRYAYDFIRTADRPGHHAYPGSNLRLLVAGARTKDFYAWGQPVHAALDGQVVTAVDGVAERRRVHPVRESWRALRNAAVLGRAGARFDPTLLAGNYVIVQSGQVCALYAHLATGSVAVTQGQRVRSGEIVGRVGHTGNSTAPHLHFQLMDSADPFRANGVPCAFAEYLVQRGSRWEPVERGVPGRYQRIRSIPPG